MWVIIVLTMGHVTPRPIRQRSNRTKRRFSYATALRLHLTYYRQGTVVPQCPEHKQEIGEQIRLHH